MSTRISPNLTLASLEVLRVFLENPRQQLAGVDILKRTGVRSGTLYPLLLRLTEAGWLHARWEDIDPRAEGRPRKRFYWLTATGRDSANDALQRLSG